MGDLPDHDGDFHVSRVYGHPYAPGPQARTLGQWFRDVVASIFARR